MNKKVVILFFLLFLSPFIFLFFKSKDFFVLHDGIYHLQRTFDFFENIKEGNIPVRWSTRLNNNFGSPIFIFLFPVPYIISSFFYFLTNNLVFAYKISNIFFIFIFMFGCFQLLKNIFKNVKSALFGSALALFTPYFLVQIFVRGAFREMAAISIFPWVLYFLIILNEQNNFKSAIRFALVLTICFLCDGLTLLTMFPFLFMISFYLFSISKSKRVFVEYILLSGLISLGISSFIILPYIFESKFINPNLVAGYFESHFVLWQNIFSLKWSFGFSEKWLPNRMPLQFGILQIFVAVLSGIFIFDKKKDRKTKFLVAISLMNIIFVVLISTENLLSHFIWKSLYFVQVLQFPWRFYSSLPLAFAICGSFVFSKINLIKINRIIVVILICLPLILSIKYLRTNQVFVIDEKQVVEYQGEASAFHEFIPKTRDTTSTFMGVAKRYEIISGLIQIKNYQQGSAVIAFIADVKESGTIQVNQLYFPGWKIYDNRKRLTKDHDYQITTTDEKIRTENKDDSGLFRIDLKKGEHKIRMNFEETSIRRLGDMISLISMTIVLGLYIMIICSYN